MGETPDGASVVGRGRRNGNPIGWIQKGGPVRNYKMVGRKGVRGEMNWGWGNRNSLMTGSGRGPL